MLKLTRWSLNINKNGLRSHYNAISSTLVRTNFRGNEILFKRASSEQKSNCKIKFWLPMLTVKEDWYGVRSTHDLVFLSLTNVFIRLNNYPTFMVKVKLYNKY